MRLPLNYGPLWPLSPVLRIQWATPTTIRSSQRSSGICHLVPAPFPPKPCISYIQQSRTFASAATEIHASKLRFGQPLFETHPHLLRPGELTPGITAAEYYGRRKALAASLPEGGIAVFKAADMKFRDKPVFYDFHQDPNFFYLTGWLEGGAVGVIEKLDTADDHTFLMFVPERGQQDEKFNGPRNGTAAAEDVFNADEAFSIETLPEMLPLILSRARTVFFNIPDSADISSQLGLAQQLSAIISQYQAKPLRNLIEQLRVVKSPAEIALVQQAGQISAKVFNKAMSKKFVGEHDLWAFLDYGFRKGGCQKEAYVPVVAGGNNGLNLHYTRNNDLLREGDMVLVDAGGQYGYYPIDITRTFPASGKFTEAQKDVYQVVLDAQKRAIALAAEDAHQTLDALHWVATAELSRGLKQLGLPYIDEHLLTTYLMPHHVGHYLGLSLHDCRSVSTNARLRRNMVITVEPGLYFPPEEAYISGQRRWPKEFDGLSVRIEDTIVVGNRSIDGGSLVLTVDAAKEVADVESLGARHFGRSYGEEEDKNAD